MGRKTGRYAEIIAYKRDRFFFADPRRNREIRLRGCAVPPLAAAPRRRERNQKKYKKTPKKGGRKHRFLPVFV
jgi:hypothetical protein